MWTNPYLSRRQCSLLAFALALVCGGPLRAGVDYTKDIKPLLHERCYACHGALKQKSKLRLDKVELMLKGGEDGAVVERGKPDKSLLIERVISTDADERMPPEHEGEPFSAAQVALLREWIAAGAPAPADEKAETDPKEHWAFRPRVRPAVPVVANAKWVRNPIDAFLAKRHEEHGLTPQPEASRAVLHSQGNTSSSSIWYELRYIEEHKDLRRGHKILQLAFGSGFKCNSAVWTRMR
jgi:hypothetical protein